MKRISFGLSLGFVLMQTAGASLITFDDITPADLIHSSGGVPQGYGGLQWNRFSVSVDPSGEYAAGIASDYTVPAFTSGPASFTLNSAYLTWFGGDAQIEVVGKSGGAVLYDNTYILSSTAPTWCDFNYTGIDTVLFFTPGSSCSFAMDNLVVNESSVAIP